MTTLQRPRGTSVGVDDDRRIPFPESVIENVLHRPDGDRTWLHYPAHGPAKGAVVFLAGTGATAEWAAEETRLPEYACAAGFHLIVPEAMRPRPQEPAKFITNPPRWNDGSPPPTPELQTNADDVGFLLELIRELKTREIINEERVHLTGFSNGAGMAFRFAAEQSQYVISLAPIAGLNWSTRKPSSPMPTFYLLGLADPLIPYRGGEVKLPWGNRIVKRPAAILTLESWAIALGCEPMSVIVEESDAIRVERFPSNTVDFTATLIPGLGHHWPGGRGGLNARIAGPSISSVNLNEMLVRFFMQQFTGR